MARKRTTDRPIENAGPSYEGPEWPPHALWPLDRIKPYPKNARTHPPEQISLLAQHLRRWGPDQPIVVDEAGVILKGHGRLEAAREAGLAEFPVVQRVGLPEAEKKAVRLADNQVALLSGYDQMILTAELRELSVDDLPLIGFPSGELQMLLANPDSDFQPVDIDGGGIDRHGEVTCPKCGHVWRR